MTLETKLSVKKRQECRDIVQEIKRYGVNQRQILHIIYLLSLELESREVMTKITEIVGESREEIRVSGLVLPGDESE